MTWGRPWSRAQRSLPRELAYAVAKAVAVTGLLLAGHVGSAVATDFAAWSEGRTAVPSEAPASTTGYQPTEVLTD